MSSLVAVKHVCKRHCRKTSCPSTISSAVTQRYRYPLFQLNVAKGKDSIFHSELFISQENGKCLLITAFGPVQSTLMERVTLDDYTSRSKVRTSSGCCMPLQCATGSVSEFTNVMFILLPTIKLYFKILLKHNTELNINNFTVEFKPLFFHPHNSTLNNKIEILNK